MFGLLILLLILGYNLVSGSGLHEACDRDEQCGTFDTYCNNGICACKENFLAILDTCIQLAVPNVQCTTKPECRSTLGDRSICKEGQCACKSFHHVHDGLCIKSRGLDEVCDFDHQCYCGRNCGSKIECPSGLCRCKIGYKQQGTRCISTGNEIESLTTMKSSFNSSAAFSAIPTRSLITFLTVKIIMYLF